MRNFHAVESRFLTAIISNHVINPCLLYRGDGARVSPIEYFQPLMPLQFVLIVLHQDSLHFGGNQLPAYCSKHVLTPLSNDPCLRTMTCSGL